MTIRVTPYFHNRWTVFFATTYTFEPRAFDDFWFRRLGDPPLNANILVDSRRLDKLYSRSEPWALQRVNSHYLVRGVGLTNGAFHPKTYFFANRTEGALLVGSGNLGMSGLEEGHEVFTAFHSADPEQVGTVRAWRDWMSRLVSSVGDDRLTSRWIAAQREAQWLQGTATDSDSRFVANLDGSILTQMVDGLAAPVDELHVLAPFYDAHAKALQEIIKRLAPRQIHVYAARDTSVDGESLAGVLRGSGADVQVFTFDPSERVHAKLVGIVAGDNGRLLSGSANTSQAALLGSVASGSANVEAGILLDTTPDRVRQAFVPHNLTLRLSSIEHLAGLLYDGTDEPAEQGYALVLKSASLLADERVRVTYTGTYGAGAILLTNGQTTQPLVGQDTAGALAGIEGSRLVWLASATGEQLSNRVAVDVPKQLDGWLQARVETSNKPDGLQGSDLSTPVGEMLSRLHEECVFDADETPAARNAQRLAGEDENIDPTFWERLLQEDLRADPRTSNYHRWAMAAADRHFIDNDDIFALMHTMLNRVSALDPPRLMGGQDSEVVGEHKPKAKWTPERRLQVRLFNVLERWCRATNDPRLRWIDRLAPTRNYVALLTAIGTCWQEGYLPAERLNRLACTLFTSFIGARGGVGYCSAVDADTRRRVIAVLSGEPAQVAAALAYCAFQPGARWVDYIFDWQPSLLVGIEDGIMVVGPDAARLVTGITGTPCSEKAIDERLYTTAFYENDQHWCDALRQEMGLNSVAFSKESMVQSVGAHLQVSGVDDPLHDPRLVILVRRLLTYRRTRHVVVSFSKGRLVAKIGDQMFIRFGTNTLESEQPLTESTLSSLEGTGSGWAGMSPAQVTAQTA
jgi:hypothetical protein